MRVHFSIRRYAGWDEAGDVEEPAGAAGALQASPRPEAGLGLQPDPAGVGEVGEDRADVLQVRQFQHQHNDDDDDDGNDDDDDDDDDDDVYDDDNDDDDDDDVNDDDNDDDDDDIDDDDDDDIDDDIDDDAGTDSSGSATHSSRPACTGWAGSANT